MQIPKEDLLCKFGPNISVTPPGSRARWFLELDEKYISPSYLRPYPCVVERGEGVYVYDVDGNKYLDFTSGIAVLTTGHSHPEIVKAIEEQAKKLIHMSGTDFYYPVQIQLAEKLAEITPGSKNKRVFFTNSGTESVEAAIKLARYNRKRPIIMAFFGAFHGRTMGSLSLTASKAVQRKYFSPLLPQVVHIPFPNPYRPPFGIPREKLSDEIIDYIKDFIFDKVAPPEEVACLIAEPIQGEGGYVFPPKEFFKKLKSLLDQYEILFIVDEIQTGMGRTGKMFAIEHYDVIPDMVTLAKGIASGLPLGALVSRAGLMNWEKGSHASTFGGNPVSCAAALKTIELLENGLVENAKTVGEFMLEILKEFESQFEFIDNVRGLGLLIAFDVVKDKNTKEPDPKLANRIVYRSFEKGLLMLTCGKSGIRIIPPLTITKDEAEAGLYVLEKVLKELF